MKMEPIAVTKEDRYKWNKELGTIGKMQMLDKKMLKVDQSYQRNAAVGKSRAIAAKFKWGGFGVIVVCRRSDGVYFVLDGQHRVIGAMLRDDIQKIPCLVFEGLPLEEEAALFVIYNKNRKSMNGLELWKAQVLAKDPETIAASITLEKYGYRILSSARKDGTDVSCPQTVWSLQHDGTLDGILKFVTDVWIDNPSRADQKVLLGVNAFRSSLKKEIGQSINDDLVVKFFKSIPLAVLLKRASVVTELSQTSAHIAFGFAMKEAWNKRRGHTKLKTMLDAA
jgi:hypothetical protein